MLAHIAIALCLAAPPHDPDTLFRQQLVAGRYAEALQTLRVSMALSITPPPGTSRSTSERSARFTASVPLIGIFIAPFASEPMAAPMEANGLFSGHLEFVTNKKDFDFQITLYELTPAGQYVLLAPFWSRARNVGHPGERRLLAPGKRERLDVHSIRLMSRQLAAGSRIVAVVQVIKETGRQINYGSGKDVSDETIADAGEPLRIEWLAGSYVEVPLRR